MLDYENEERMKHHLMLEVKFSQWKVMNNENECFAIVPQTSFVSHTHRSTRTRRKIADPMQINVKNTVE